MGLKSFIGGVHPYEGKEFAENAPIKEVLPKGELIYPVSQHIGAPATPIVAVGDTVSLSEDFLAKAKNTKGTDLAVGDIITIGASLVAGQQLDHSAGAPSAGNKYLKITKIFNSHIPVFLGGDGKMFPGVYKMYDLEVFEA